MIMLSPSSEESLHHRPTQIHSMPCVSADARAVFCSGSTRLHSTPCPSADARAACYWCRGSHLRSFPVVVDMFVRVDKDTNRPRHNHTLRFGGRPRGFLFGIHSVPFHTLPFGGRPRGLVLSLVKNGLRGACCHDMVVGCHMIDRWKIETKFVIVLPWFLTGAGADLCFSLRWWPCSLGKMSPLPCSTHSPSPSRGPRPQHPPFLLHATYSLPHLAAATAVASYLLVPISNALAPHPCRKSFRYLVLPRSSRPGKQTVRN